MDISMCENKECTMNNDCYRFKAKPNEFMQSYGNFEQNEDGSCDYYMKDYSITHKENNGE